MTTNNNSLVKEMVCTVKESKDQIISWRRHMHQHPELSFNEVKTALFIKAALEEMGIKVRSNIGGNGVIGILEGAKPGKTIALRADFDALPIQDEKNVPYKSKNPGVMHACGHDGHTAALLGTAKVLSGYTQHLHGTIIFLFQPAEEALPGGAKAMIEDGILQQVDYIFAAHLDSQTPLGKIPVGSGYQMAAVDQFSLTIQGKGGHGAHPHTAIDSVVVGSDIVNALQKIVSRSVNPQQAAVITVGKFLSGTAFNIIADKALLEGTIRTFDPQTRTDIEIKLRQIVDGITSAFGASYTLDYVNGYPALYNPPYETEVVRALLADHFNSENIIEMQPSMGAEDFSYFLLEKPGTYFRVGAQNENPSTHWPHHHPLFDFDEKALIILAECFIKIVTHYVCKPE